MNELMTKVFIEQPAATPGLLITQGKVMNLKISKYLKTLTQNIFLKAVFQIKYIKYVDDYPHIYYPLYHS